MHLQGEPVYHYGYVATFATHSVVPESCAIPIRADMPLEKAALIGCSVMTGAGAVLNTAQVPAGAGIAVFGTGGIGLNTIQGGRIVGAHPIIAVDVRPNKLEFARSMGASHLVDASHDDPVQAVRRITGLGADYSFVAVGDTRAIQQAFECLAPGGLCVVIGLPPSGETVTLDPRRFVGGERTITGSSYGGARTWADFPRMVDLYLAGILKIDELITRRYPLEDANEAFRALAAGEVARSILVM
jgi:S-(hydroxymethyl)glutathione dehydrogenase/alcohol dehydrogenase